MSWSAGIAGCAKPGPAIVRGTLKVFFLLLVSFLVTTGGVAAVALAPLSLPAPFPESSSAPGVACGKHSRSKSYKWTVGSHADGSTASNVTCSTISRDRLKKKAKAASLLAEDVGWWYTRTGTPDGVNSCDSQSDGSTQYSLADSRHSQGFAGHTVGVIAW